MTVNACRVVFSSGIARTVCLALAAVFAAACAVPISYYDATTYTNLTSLKAETTSLIETFDEKTYDKNEAKIEAASLSFLKAYEYEKGKGAPNSDTARQFEIIRKLYLGAVTDYRARGPGGLGKKFFGAASTQLGQAFDIAIATENLKNKDKR